MSTISFEKIPNDKLPIFCLEQAGNPVNITREPEYKLHTEDISEHLRYTLTLQELSYEEANLRISDAIHDLSITHLFVEWQPVVGAQKKVLLGLLAYTSPLDMGAGTLKFPILETNNNSEIPAWFQKKLVHTDSCTTWEHIKKN